MIPDSPLGDKLRWLLGVLERSGRAVSEADVADHLNRAFEQQVPPDQFLGVTEQVGGELNPSSSIVAGPKHRAASSLFTDPNDEDVFSARYF